MRLGYSARQGNISGVSWHQVKESMGMLHRPSEITLDAYRRTPEAVKAIRAQSYPTLAI